MSKFIDLTGKKYNLLKAIEVDKILPSGQRIWKCQCDCGNITFVRGYNLKNGSVKSCGCLLTKKKDKREADSPLYHTWCGIKRRCLSDKDNAYKYYGARGITICQEWLNFYNFEKWALENGYSSDMTIDRIDNNKGYCPENCHFTDKKTQANNRRSNILFSYNGETKNLQQWCELLNLNYKLVHNRIHKLKWDFNKAISTPCNENKRNKRRK